MLFLWQVPMGPLEYDPLPWLHVDFIQPQTDTDGELLRVANEIVRVGYNDTFGRNDIRASQVEVWYGDVWPEVDGYQVTIKTHGLPDVTEDVIVPKDIIVSSPLEGGFLTEQCEASEHLHVRYA